MEIVIIGVGKIGGTLVESLIKEKHNIVVVDNNGEVVDDIVNRYDVKGIVGSGFERAVMLDAGVQKADFVICSSARDELNILCCVLAKKLGARYTIARVRDPEYFAEIMNMTEYLGIDFALNPEYYTAKEISHLLKFPSANKIISFADGKADMAEFEILEGNPLVSKSLIEIRKEFPNKILFVSVKRGGNTFIPHGDFVIEEGDLVYILGSEADIQSFTKKLKIYKHNSRSIFIIGGGKIAFYLAKRLMKSGVKVKILEADEQRCEELSRELPKVTVLHGDGTDQNVLAEEDLKSSDACITLTGIDEENVIISLFAKKQAVDKVITKVDRPSIMNMVSDIGLDSVVTPRNIVANHVIRFVRERSNEDRGADVINQLYMIDDDVETLEFTVSENFAKKAVPLKELKLIANVLIGGIVRHGQFIIPSGDTSIEVGDRVLVVVTSKQINDLEQILR